MTAMLPAHLSESLNNLGDAARQLTEEVRTDRQARRKRDRFMVAMLVVLSLMVVGLATLGVMNRRTNQQIADCTTNEQGECFQKGQQRTGGALMQIRRDGVLTSIYVHQCARVADTDAELEACVQRKLAAAAPAPAPSPSPSP